MAITVSIRSPEDVINAALTRIGYSRRVDQSFEGTPAARAAMLVYGQTRDMLLREGDFRFCVRSLMLTPQKVAPAPGYNPAQKWNPADNPPVPWIFQYAYPTDCLRVLSLRRAPTLIPNFSPRAVTWQLYNDTTFVPAQKVILTNLQDAIATYNARVVDPTVWEASFAEALIDAMAERLAPVLAKIESQQIESAAEEKAQMKAEHLQG